MSFQRLEQGLWDRHELGCTVTGSRSVAVEPHPRTYLDPRPDPIIAELAAPASSE